MAEGTFTLVDDRIFYPIVNFHENKKSSKSSNESNSKIVNHDSESDEGEKSETHSHRKVSRRRISKKISKKKKKGKKRRLFFENNVKLETNFQNGFEFCTTISDNVEIKQEATSEIDMKSNSDSDDDIPLASLDKHSSTKYDLNTEKQNQIDNLGDGIKLETMKETDDVKIHKTEKFQTFFCSKCDEFYKTKKLYLTHIRKIHGKLYKCKLCLMSYDKKEDLEDHQNVHTGNRPYCCYICENESFKTETALKTHMKKYHTGKEIKESKKFSCYVCGKILSTKFSLEEHSRLHSGEKPVECPICDKTFVRVNDLRQHQNIHEELWKCKHCQKCFSTPFKLKEHVRSHTGELPYECDKCDRKFARVADFRYHVGTHLGIKPYACLECGMNFTTSSSVTRHRLNMHQLGPKQYECPHCSKKFHIKERLTSHIKRHENSKKFKCELCPAARSSVGELNKHMIIHGGQFRCDTCHRGFQNAQRLAAHTARHDIAGKPYACFVCSIGYHSSQGLNKHLATVHRNEDIPQIAPQHLCTLCGQVFELKDKLNRHLKENHIVIVVGEIHPLEDNDDCKTENIQQRIDAPHNPPETSKIETKNPAENKTTNKECIEDPISDKSKRKSENPDSGNDVPQIRPPSDLEINDVATLHNDENEDNIIAKTLVASKQISSSPTSQPEINRSEESTTNTNASTAEHNEKTKLNPSVLNVPVVNHSIDNTKSGSDLSSSPLTNVNSEVERNSSMPNHKMHNPTSFTRTFPGMLPLETNVSSSANYRPSFENQIQTQSLNHVNNPWFLPKTDTAIPHPQSLPRSFYESRQRYELRMPKFNTLSMHQLSDYRNTNTERIPFPEHRNDIPIQTPIRNREILNNQKYFYETDNLRNLKDYCVDISQRETSDDRRKYNQQIPQFSTDLPPRQIIHNYPNHIIPSRDYSTLGAHDLSNSANMNIQNLHYTNHAFSSSPDFFHNFRDLQHKILKTQEYEHTRHVSPPAIMDMTNHRLNPASPISPYNQTSSHILETMSPMSRNSYEDSSNSQIPSSLMYGNQARKHDMTPSGVETNSNNNRSNNSEKMSNDRS